VAAANPAAPRADFVTMGSLIEAANGGPPTKKRDG
jgi:hypothetical protein